MLEALLFFHKLKEFSLNKTLPGKKHGRELLSSSKISNYLAHL
jgi:hypothetical protein